MRRNLLILLAVALALPTIALAADRAKELGVVNYYAKYDAWHPGRTKGYDKAVKAYFENLKALGFKPEWVDVDIFLKKGKAERDACKRIVIPQLCDVFTREMYEGMDDYVRGGGLLFTQVSCVIEDTDKSYSHNKGDKVIDYTPKGFLGVRGTGGCAMNEIKVLVESPLTEGLKVGEWIKLPKTTYGRRTSPRGAEVLIVAKQENRGKTLEGPFLTVKKSGKGACVYLVGYFSSMKQPTMARLVKNALSEKTLKALCPRE